MAQLQCFAHWLALVEQFKLSNVYKRSMRSMAAMGKSEMQSLRRVARLAFALL